MTTLILTALLCIIAAETGYIIILMARRQGKVGSDDSAERLNREKIAAIGRFSSVVSHELKNPLASLKNIAYFFSKMPAQTDPRASRMMGILGTEVDRMNDLILHLLDMSRIKIIEKLPCDVGSLAEETFQKTPLPDTITVSKSIEHATLPLDAQRFKQVISALITNARDAMPAGGRIDFSLKPTGSSVEIVLADTGIGMDEVTCRQAFDPLFTTKTKVLGMGLTMAREIVRIHNGTIELTSAPGAGTTVTITFPTPPPQEKQ